MGTIKTSIQKLNPTTLTNPDVGNDKHSGRVDINNLLARVRKKQTEENKVNLVFFALFAALVLIVGILLSF